MNNDWGDDLLAGTEDSEAARRLGVDGFVALWHGERPEIVRLTDDLAAAHALVRAGRLDVDEDGRLMGVHGLSARPTAHRIEHERGQVHTWCAFDAIGIPAALAIDAAAVTTCPACGVSLRVSLHGGDPDDRGEQLWFPGGPCAHLVEDFCHHANLYCSTAHLSSTVMPGTTGQALTVAQAADIGRTSWRDVSAVLT